RLDPAKDDNAYTADYRAWASAGGKVPAPAPAAPAAAPAAPAPASALAAPKDVQDLMDRWDLYLGPVVVTGLGAGVPGSFDKVFREDAMDCLLDGKNLIDKLPEDQLHKQVEKNLERVVKSETGNHGFERLTSIEQVIRLAGRAGQFDFSGEFGVRGSISSLMDRTAQLGLAAGILALKDARIPLVRHYKRSTTGKLIPTTWGLPTPLQEETGVIMATAWPGLDSLVEDLTRYFASKYAAKPQRLVYEMYDRMIGAVKDPADRKALTDWYVETRNSLPAAGAEEDVYKFSRGFLFRVLALGHAQTSQFIRAKGPCTQVNSACASTTQAMGIAEDWIRTGRAKRVLVISADDITNPNLMHWIGLGFLASGAATTKDVVSEAALPFDRRRNGMIVGMGASALVVEDGRLPAARGVTPRAELLATQFDNSAYHVTRLSTRHVAETMRKLVAKAEKRHGLERSQMAAKMLFMSHETYTPAQGGSSAAEVEALKAAFGPDTEKVVVTNTKGFTGHSMGASLEDVIAIHAMNMGRVPPIANYKEPDPNLSGITLSKGGAYDCEYALRLGAGFGSQIAMTLSRRTWKAGQPRVDEPRYQGWLSAVTGRPAPELEVVLNTLRVKDTGAPAQATDEGEEGVKPAAAPVPAPAAAPAPAARPASLGDEAQVSKEIVALVSEKTGYPAEMLELDLDMEADLGIDTVKQAELIGLIRDKYSIPKAENLSLKDYPTLRHVVKFVLAGGGGASSAETPAAAPVPSAAPVPVVVPEEAEAVAAPAAPVVESRFGTWALESYDRPAEGKAPALSKEKPVVVLAADPEKAAPFAEAVAAAGGEAVVVKTDWPELEKAEAALRKALKKRPCAGVLDVTSLEPADMEKAYKRGPRSLFMAAKVLREDLSAPGAFLAVVTRTGGDHGCSSPAEFDPMAGAVTGLAKGLARELPSLAVRAVDFDAAAEPAEMARRTLEEVGSSDPRLEVGWQAGTRRALRLVRRPLPAEAPRKLTSRSVVLITGGGQGLGAELAKELAARAKCQLVLVGRTPLEKQAATWVRLSEAELEAMKKEMWEKLKADKTVKATPALLNKRFSQVTKAIALHRAVEAMSLAGSKVQYLQADMADGAEVAKAVKAALKAHGRVDYVVHAAGLEESKLLADKKLEDFD
ncbi:MAG: SDR family NAD(P)-dependent oxidoreductase, partial [Elusimicrobia bacterium]|nr:SDR family NAD(P)-dependent oxidoreductase [Elusimicrobiota bacterium]